MIAHSRSVSAYLRRRAIMPPSQRRFGAEGVRAHEFTPCSRLKGWSAPAASPRRTISEKEVVGRKRSHADEVDCEIGNSVPVQVT